MTDSYGTFGANVSAYEAVRREYPVEIFSLIRNRLNRSHITVRALDAGCGTGISTRQLASCGLFDIVHGIDRDARMIDAARAASASTSRIEYSVATIEDSGWADDEFDAVTAFESFHWFKTSRALEQIHRVLRERGIFVVVNRNNTGGFNIPCQKAMQRFMPRHIPSAKSDYNPAVLLSKNGFKEILTVSLKQIEVYTVADALTYMTSTSRWNEVPPTMRKKAKSEMLGTLKKIAKKGSVQRELDIVTTIGTVSK